VSWHVGDRVQFSRRAVAQMPWWVRWYVRQWRGTVVSVIDADSAAGQLTVRADRGNEVEMPFDMFEVAP
jgi:hypothetical protein